jgi:hypothetical protein
MQVSARWTVEQSNVGIGQILRWRPNGGGGGGCTPWAMEEGKMYPGAGGGLSLLTFLICKRRKRNTEGSEPFPAKYATFRVGCQLPSVHYVGSGGGAERTPHTHTHTFTSIHRRGVEGRNSGWVLWLLPGTCTEGHRRGRTGLDSGLSAAKTRKGRNMHRLRSADLHMDGKGQQQRRRRRRQQCRTALLHCRGREMV